MNQDRHDFAQRQMAPAPAFAFALRELLAMPVGEKQTAAVIDIAGQVF